MHLFPLRRIYYVYTTKRNGAIMIDRKESEGVKIVTTATTVKSWGNSLAVRIPKNIADMLSIGEGSEVELSVVDQKIILVPKKQPKKYSLEELLSKITLENQHREIDYGTEGNEII